MTGPGYPGDAALKARIAADVNAMLVPGMPVAWSFLSAEAFALKGIVRCPGVPARPRARDHRSGVRSGRLPLAANDEKDERRFRELEERLADAEKRADKMAWSVAALHARSQR